MNSAQEQGQQDWGQNINISPIVQNYHQEDNLKQNLLQKKQASQDSLQQNKSKDLDQFLQIGVDQLSGDQGVESTTFLQTAKVKQKPKANMIYTIFTVMNCTIGIGVLAMPYTVYVLGWLFSLLSFIFIVLVNQYSIIILIKVKNLTKHSNYSTISKHIFKGKLLCIFVSSLICIGNFGYCVALFSIMKGTLRKMMVDFIKNQQILKQFYVSQQFIVLICGILSFPTVLVKRIETLRYAAFVGVLGIIFSLIAYGIIFFTQMSQRGWKNQYQMRAFPQSLLDTLAVIPNIGLALVYQMNFYSIYKGLKNTNDKRANIATSIGTGSSAIIYFILGLMGYWLFGMQQTPNFLISIIYGQINIFLYLMVYSGFLISVFFCVPVNAMVVRCNLLAMIKLINQQQNSKDRINLSNEHIKEADSILKVSNKNQLKKNADRLFYFISTLVHILALLISILVQSLQSVFNFVGAISSTSIGFIIPFLFYFLLVKRKKQKKNINYYLSIVGMIIFIPFGIIAVISLYI